MSGSATPPRTAGTPAGARGRRPWYALEEKHAILATARGIAIIAAAVVAIVAPLDMTSRDLGLALGACAAALVVHGALAALPVRWPRTLGVAVDASLVADALFVLALALVSGGPSSPALWLLPFLVMAATLGLSVRTGLKAAILGVLVVIGTLAADGAATPFTNESARWLGLIVAAYATAAAFAKVNELELQRRGERLDALHEAGTAFVAADDAEALGGICRAAARRLLPGWEVEIAAPQGTVSEQAWRDAGRVGLEVPAVARQEGQDRVMAVIRAHRPIPRRGTPRVRSRQLMAVRTLATAYAAALMRVELIDQLEQLSLADPLTGLGNRRTFDEALHTELARARRTGRPVGLMLLDLDHFKTVNDSHGHQAGDDALIAVADILSEAARAEDRACRVGGEEFALLLPGADEEAATEVAERVRRAVEAHGFGFGTLTVSVGVAAAHGWSPPTRLLSAADTRLYAAKEAGRNRVVSADPEAVP